MKISLVACLLSLAACLGRSRAASNIDVLEPIVRVSPAQGSNEDYFGYAVVLHQVEVPDRGDFHGALNAARIIVGAPAGTYPGGLDLPNAPNATNMTGLVYLCPVNPGDCEGLRSNETDNDRRLFDDEANDRLGDLRDPEQKNGQFMGATLQSTGSYFMACAPRYVTITPASVDGRRPHGRCYFSPRNLTGFVELRPCAGGDSYNQENSGAFCMVGTGATIYNNGSDSLLVLGAPGQERSRGALYFYSAESPETSTSSGPSEHQVPQNNNTSFRTVDDLYQGFTLTTGNIRSKDEADVITSLPRFNGVTYTGGVRFFDVNDISNPSEIFPSGTQTGEYFGWALATADLNGDGFDELIVGAPMYSSIFSPETGRVYVFENIEGILTEEPIALTRDVAYSRFGSSIVNIGDANNDGYEDIAIGAPYMDLGSDLANGSVFVYYGNPDTVIEDTPGQIISARDVVDAVDGLDELTTFGYSLASQVDVDANEYDDLVVGSYSSQAVVLFRTLSIADIEVNTTNDGLVNINNLNCVLSNGSFYACFNVSICASYTGRGLQNRSLETTLRIRERTSVAETNEQRLFFDFAPFTNTLDMPFTFSQDGVQECLDVVTYVLHPDSIGDIFSTLVLDISFLQLPRDPIAVTGNQTVTDLRETPLLRVSGELEINATVDAECGEICFSDLVLEVDQVTYVTTVGNEDRLLVDATNIMEVTVTYYNDMNAEDAILAQLLFCLPPLLRHSRVDPVTDTNRVFDCSPGNQGDNDTICDLNEMPEGTPYTCDLEQLLRANGENTTLLLRWVVQSAETLRGNEPDFKVPIAIGIPSPDEGRNRENETERGNNNRTIVIDVAAVVDIEIPSVTFSTTDITYSGANPLESRATNITANDLGSRFELITEVVNNGPSSIPEALLTIYLPINSSETGKFYYLYPAELAFSAREGGLGTGIDCSGSPYINPDGLLVQSNTNSRRRRSVLNPDVREHRRRVRMAERGRRQTSQALTSDNTVCSPSNVDSCVPIQCILSDVTSASTLVITIIGYIDERFFQNRDQTFAFQAYANVSISENLDYIEEPDATNNGQQSNTLLVSRRSEKEDDEFPWWIAFVCVLGALILIVILFVILYCVGFFRRKRPEKEEAEGDFESPVQGVAIKELPSDDQKTEEVPSDQKPEKPDLADEGDGTYETEI